MKSKSIGMLLEGCSRKFLKAIIVVEAFHNVIY